MKTLLENTIRPWYTGKGPNFKTIFDSNDTSARKYFNISSLSGKKIYFDYSYQNNEDIIDGTSRVDIPLQLNEQEVKQFIIDQLNITLNN
jgi:hypothetical protein